MDGSAEHVLEHVGSGRMGAVFRFGDEAVKFDRVQGKADVSPVMVANISEEESDALCAAWELVGAPGLSPHVLRPLRKQTFKPRDGVMSTADGRACTGIVTEYVQGVRTCSGAYVRSFYDVIAAGMAGQFIGADGTDAFPDLFKAVLFQVTFTIAAWLRASNSAFRHNDLNAHNVCVTQWRPDGAAVTTAYQMFGADGVERTFILHTPYRAVIIDLGFAAVLPAAGGTDFDERFYFDNFAHADKRNALRVADTVDDAAPVHGFKEVLYERSGMSHWRPCVHYDLLFFLYAAYEAVGRGHAAGRASPAGTAAAKAFMKLYEDTFCSFHSSSLCSSKYPGRLRPQGQESLAANRGAVRLRRLQGRAHVLPSPILFLFHVYFTELRAPAVVELPPTRVFGFHPSDSAVQPHIALGAIRKSVCCLAKNEHFVSRVEVDASAHLLHKPVPGLWRDLIAKWDGLRAHARAQISHAATPIHNKSIL